MIVPACRGQMGRIFCDCIRTDRAMECLRARYQWIKAENIAGMPTDRDRHAAINQLARNVGEPYSLQVKDMAKTLMRAAA